MTTIASPGELADLPASARSRLLQSIAERERLERALLLLPTALGEEPLARVLQVFAEAVGEVAGARLVLVALNESAAPVVACGPDAIAPPPDLRAVPALTPAFEGRELYFRDATSDLPQIARGALQLTPDGRGMRSLLLLPIRGRTAWPLGVLVLAHHRARAFSDRQLALARALASYLGHTIDVTAVAAEQTRISVALQESLLPPLLPTIPGLDLAARYRPGGHGNLVGGDFYDVFPIGSGSWGVLLGDASGIGPEAAGLAGIARYTARALAESAPPPVEFLQQLNRAVLRAAPEGRFCSAVLAGFSQEGDCVRVLLASAGHPPPFLQTASGGVRVAMEDTGTILGFAENAPMGKEELLLGPGDALVLYTDGVTEARGPEGDLFGEQRLGEVLAEAAGRSAEGTARRLELEVLDHRGSRNLDDIALVVARVPPRLP